MYLGNKGRKLLEAFLEGFLMTLVASAVLALPLWIVALIKGRRDILLGFGTGMVAIAFLFGLMSVATEASVDSCEASGGIGCADLYFAAGGALFLFLGAWFVVTLITAIYLATWGTRSNAADAEHL